VRTHGIQASRATMQWGYPQPRSGEGDAQRDEEEAGYQS
jgi:hypothetical protein